MKETLQLQFGAFSNGIAAEMINMEYYRSISGDEQIDHSCFLRPLDSDPECQVEPRVVAYDLEGNFNPGVFTSGTKYEADQLYRDLYEPWGGIISESCGLHEHNRFRISTDDARFFTVVADANDYILSNESLRDDAFEPIRYQIEKCDHIDVVHSVVDLNHGFGGLAAGALVMLQDDYCRASTVQFVTFGACPHMEVAGRSLGAHDRRLSHDLNRFIAFSTLSPMSSIFIPMQSTLANDTALGVYGLGLHVNTSAYRLKDGWNARDLFARLTTSNATLGSVLAIPLDRTFDNFQNEPMTNDHLLFQGDRNTCTEALDRLNLERGSLRSDQTELLTPSKVAPSSVLAREHNADKPINIDVIGQWRSAETTFEFVNELWKKTAELKTFLHGDHAETDHVENEDLDEAAEYLSHLKADLVYYRSQHVIRTAPQIRVVHQ